MAAAGLSFIACCGAVGLLAWSMMERRTTNVETGDGYRWVWSERGVFGVAVLHDPSRFGRAKMWEYAGRAFDPSLKIDPPDFVAFMDQARMTYPTSSVAGIVVGRGDFYRMFPNFPGVQPPPVMPTFWLVRVPYIHIIWIMALLPAFWVWGQRVRSGEDHVGD